MRNAIDRYKNQKYTGENRCLPCTAVNVVLAALLGTALGVLSLPFGVMAFAVGLGSIYFRGYLVPGTPELTKRYFPDWLLTKFDKVDEPPIGTGSSPGSVGDVNVGDSAGTVTDTDAGDAVERARRSDGTEGIVDPETLLTAVDVVEECQDRNDLCLTDGFAEEWSSHADQLRDDREAQQTAVAELFCLDAVTLTRDDDGRFVASVGDEQFNAWVTEGALLADLAAATVIADRADWPAILPAQRVAILRALRSFLDVCPMCGGDVRMTQDTVDSCCRTWDVLAVRCGDCDTHFLEINPDRLGATTAESEGSSDTEAGANSRTDADDAGDNAETPADGESPADTETPANAVKQTDGEGNGSTNAESVDPGFTRG